MPPTATPPPINPALSEPPVPADGVLVPGSRYSDRDWALAAHRLALGWPVVQVAQAMGCHRNTVWRALQISEDFRARVAWERECLRHEAETRLASAVHLAAANIEKAVQEGDLKASYWVLDRLGPSRMLAPPPGPAKPVDPKSWPETEEEGPDRAPLDWQDAFKPDLPLPR
ncbi:MAG TPA: helix-turn-helix domain-containing protein [Azospirillum sp.]|nr:helix-turn-helix domain-containing protein [Azospirillum sp.]